MNKLQQWIALTVVACLALLAAGWFLLVSPKRAEAADLRDQAASQDQANDATRTQLQVLKAQAKDLPNQQAALAKVAARIPDNPALPSLIRSLSAASQSAGVEFVSVAPGSPVPVVAAAPAGTAAAAPTPAPGTATAASSAGTLTAIPVAINVVGGFFEVEQFVANLENLPRALRVSNLTLAPGKSPTDQSKTGTEDGSSLTTTISGTVFMDASRAAATAVIAPGQPVPTASAPAVAPAASPSPAAAK